MKRRKLVALFMAVAMGAALVACGGSDSSSGSENEAAEGESGDGESLSGDLVIYTSAPEADNNAILTAFGDLYPDVNIELIQGNQGEGIARIQAEADNPTIDVMYTGINDTDGDTYADLFEAYESESNSDNPEEFQSNGFYNYCMVSTCCICVNTDLADELGVEIKGYEDLTDPELEGKFIMSDPTASSSAWNNVCNLFTIYGNDSQEAWDLMEDLLANGMVVTDSSSACFNNVQAGEYVAGITYEGGPIDLLSNGADNIEIVYPEEGVSGSIFASAIVKDAPDMDNAKAFVDWMTSLEGQQAMLDNGSPQRRIADGIDFSTGVVPELDTELLGRDTEWLVENKDAMIEKWTELYTQYHN